VRNSRRRHGGGPLAAAAAAIYASDAFNRSDRVLDGDTADAGGIWHRLSGTWTILTNQAKNTVAAGYVAIYIDDAQSDGAWRVTGVNVTNGGPMIRAADDSNWIGLRWSGVLLNTYRRTAGAMNQIASYSGTQNPGDAYELTAAGAVITAYQNGTQRTQVSETQGQTNTKHGLFSGAAGQLYDDYSHKAN
jgi:hypothetical protein